MLFVKSALDSLGISPYEIIYYNELIYKLILNKNLRDYLFERNGIKIYASSSMSEFKYVNLLLEHNYIEQAFNIIEDMKTRVDDNPEFEKLKSRVLDAYLMYA